MLYKSIFGGCLAHQVGKNPGSDKGQNRQIQIQFNGAKQGTFNAVVSVTGSRHPGKGGQGNAGMLTVEQ